MLFIRSTLFNIFYLLWTILFAVGLLPLLVGPRKGLLWLSYVWPKGVIIGLRILCGVKVELRGQQYMSQTPVIYAAKHQSALDILILLTALRYPVFVIKKELLFIPLYGLYLWHFGMIAVDRSKGASAMKRILRMAEGAVAAGRSLVIYPEGTRTAPGAPPAYQPGVAAMYKHLDLPVVPVAVNTGLFWGRNSYIKRPGTTIIEFLPPIPPGQKAREFMNALERAIEPASTKLLAA